MEIDSGAPHPGKEAGGGTDGHAGEMLISVAAGDAEQIVPVFVFIVGSGERAGGAEVHGTEVPGVAAIAAAECAGGMFDQQDGSAVLARGDCGAESGIAASSHKHVVCPGKVGHPLGW